MPVCRSRRSAIATRSSSSTKCTSSRPRSFNALLKSIEEPPAHVVFMMATTELHKIPDTILSRSQVFEFKTIPTRAIVEQLRRIADAEKIDVPDAALSLIARAAEGSMRDAQSAFDQVIAFAGQTITVDDVSTVLGLVGRDLLFDLIDAVIDEDGPRAFALADRAVESGHDLKLVCRELSRVVRDLMIVSVDPAPRRRRRAGRRRARTARCAGAALLARRPDARVRPAGQGRDRHPHRVASALSLRDGAAALDARAQAGAARGSDGAARRRRSSHRLAAPEPPEAGSRHRSGTTRAPHATKHSVAPTASEACTSNRPTASIAPADSTDRTSRSDGERTATSVRGLTRRGAEGRAARRDPQRQEDPVRAVDRHRAADRCQRRCGDVHVRGEPERGARQPGTEPPVDRSRRAAPGRPAHERRGRAVADAGRAGRRSAAVEPNRSPRPRQPTDKPKGSRDLKAEAMSSSAVQAMLDVFPAEIRDVEEM